VACLTRDVGQLHAVHRQKGRVSAGTPEPRPDKDEFGGHGERLVVLVVLVAVEWGYIVVEPHPADPRPKPPRSAWVVRSTVEGRKAQEIWRPLFGVIEKRWQERFGKDEIDELREALGQSSASSISNCPTVFRFSVCYSAGGRIISRQPRRPAKKARVNLCPRFSHRYCWPSPLSSRASRRFTGNQRRRRTRPRCERGAGTGSSAADSGLEGGDRYVS
jgi:hypothetical protein